MHHDTSPQKKQDVPLQSFRWLRPYLPKKMQPLLRGLRKKWQQLSLDLAEPFHSVFPYTQASPARQENLVCLCEEIEREGIEGAVVECGVLDGGTAALMAYATKQSSRPVHLFDAWKGLPKAIERDGVGSEQWVGQVVGSPKRVLEVMEKLAVSSERLFFHQGWFEETFPVAVVEKIALLHIDCDFYEPTALCLERWYRNVVSGGFIQFDDYGCFKGCTNAVDEFLQAHPLIQLKSAGQPEQGTAFFLRKP